MPDLDDQQWNSLMQQAETNIVYNLVKCIGTKRPDENDSRLPVHRMLMGLIEYIANFFWYIANTCTCLNMQQFVILFRIDSLPRGLPPMAGLYVFTVWHKVCQTVQLDPCGDWKITPAKPGVHDPMQVCAYRGY